MPDEAVVDEPTETEEAADTHSDEEATTNEENMEPAVETEPVD